MIFLQKIDQNYHSWLSKYTETAKIIIKGIQKRWILYSSPEVWVTFVIKIFYEWYSFVWNTNIYFVCNLIVIRTINTKNLNNETNRNRAFSKENLGRDLT